MFGLEFLAAGYLHLASTGAQMQCPVPSAPEITVSAVGLDTKINETLSVLDLTAASNAHAYETPYDKDAVVHTEGLRFGKIRVKGKYYFQTHTNSKIGKGCLFFSKVNVEIKLDPTIYIAKEYKRGTCHYDAIMEHEKKHIAVDREVVNRHINYIVKAVDNTLKHYGYVQGPMDVAQIPAMQERMSEIVDSVIQQFHRNMNVENKKLQVTTVDTLQEYNRVDSVCNDKAKKKGRMEVSKSLSKK